VQGSRIAHVALDETVAGVREIAERGAAVLVDEAIEVDDFVAVGEQMARDRATDVARTANEQHAPRPAFKARSNPLAFGFHSRSDFGWQFVFTLGWMVEVAHLSIRSVGF